MEFNDYLNTVGLSKNPFVLVTSEEIPLVSNDATLSKIQTNLNADKSLLVVVGPTGSGKSSMIQWIMKHDNLRAGNRIIKKIIPVDHSLPYEEIQHQLESNMGFTQKIKSWFIGNKLGFERRFGNTMGDDIVLLLFDEVQDYPDVLFTNLRALHDFSKNVRMIFFGLPELTNKLSEVTSFRKRADIIIQIAELPSDSLRRIIESRIIWVGGQGIKPFTDEAINELIKTSIPRDLIENCRTVLEWAAVKELPEIRRTDVVDALRAVKQQKPAVSIEPEEKTKSNIADYKPAQAFSLEDFPKSQQTIINLLMSEASLSVNEISEKGVMHKFQVMRELKKLIGDDEEEKDRRANVEYPVVVCIGKEKREGRLQKVYSISNHARTMFAKK